MKNFIATTFISISLLLVACDRTPQYDAASMASIQPCLSMGFPATQCMAAYQQAGRPSDTNWLGTVAAFAAGAAVGHWWNRTPSYVYHPEYMSQPDYWDRNYRADTRRNWATPPLQGIKPATNTIQPIPEKNTTSLIPNQQVQPMFKPNVIVPNQTSKSTVPPTTSSSAFKPIQVVPSTPSKSSSTTSSFKPIQVTPYKSSSSKSSSSSSTSRRR